MLVQLICGVPVDKIVADYMESATTLNNWTLSATSRGSSTSIPDSEHAEQLPSHLRGEQVLSVEEEYMVAAIEHIEKEYGDIAGYMHAWCLRQGAASRARECVLVCGGRSNGLSIAPL